MAIDKVLVWVLMFLLGPVLEGWIVWKLCKHFFFVAR
jgi:hypothetical protein